MSDVGLNAVDSIAALQATVQQAMGAARLNGGLLSHQLASRRVPSTRIRSRIHSARTANARTLKAAFIERHGNVVIQLHKRRLTLGPALENSIGFRRASRRHTFDIRLINGEQVASLNAFPTSAEQRWGEQAYRVWREADTLTLPGKKRKAEGDEWFHIE
ncbi:MAG: hypothetical protein M1826_001582 [Phylliscum demangeonii]|nr:MAG: hypothetical protein M1826_001582 [Phylliscum demangeonii]